MEKAASLRNRAGINKNKTANADFGVEGQRFRMSLNKASV